MTFLSVSRPSRVFVFLFTALCLLSTRAFAEPTQVTLETTQGNIVLELNAERAPQTVRNFLQYVDDGFYNDTLFHRVIEGFMIQGGGFSTTYQRKTTRPPISNEAYNGLRNDRYTIAMARTTAPHSATAQFFINSEDNHNLNHTGTNQRGWGYTVFGKVVEGHDVVDAISQTRTSSGGPFSRDVPKEPVIILSAIRLDASQAAQPAEASEGANAPTAKPGSSKSLKPIDTDLEGRADSAPVQQN